MARRTTTVAERGRWTLGALALASVAVPWGLRLQGDDEECDALRARVEVLEADRASLQERVAALVLELARERDARLAREQHWLSYTRTIAALVPPERRDQLPSFGPQLPAAGAADPNAEREPGPAELAARRRAEEVRDSLRALLFVEGVRGMDLLEVGDVQAGHVGPVVFRLLGADGRLAGSLVAERLSLEASLAGRTLTMVLEDGRESHGGHRTEFGSSGDPEGLPPWRIPLVGLDPAPWIESLGELFGETEFELPPDDGRWDLAYVQVKLNELLRQDVASGWYRLKRFAGVQDGVLREVHVEVLRPDGAVERRLFADRLALQPSSQGVVLVFEDGVTLRGEERAPFLEGVYRAYLSRARVETWVAAGLPGLVERPSGPAAARRRPPR